MLSTRNIDSGRQYTMLYRGAQAEARMRNDDALQEAVDRAVGEHRGEYMMNVAVYVKENGKKVKVVGDVWGYGQ